MKTIILLIAVIGFVSAAGNWPGCEFKLGMAWDGKQKASWYSKFDYLTFWIGANSCERGRQCTDFNNYWEGDFLRQAKELNKPIVLYAYIITFEARVTDGLKDCNMGTPNLCQKGANFIRSHRQQILDRFLLHAQKINEIYGTANPATFIINPDLWEYHAGGDGFQQEGGGLSMDELGQLFFEIVQQIKKGLPNAKISWDISPWLSESDMTSYWKAFSKSHSQIDFINTSGGGNFPDSNTIQRGHGLSWSFMNKLTGKKIIADCGYGVGGAPDNNCGAWQSQANSAARIKDGVIMVSTANADKFNFNPQARAKTC